MTARPDDAEGTMQGWYRADPAVTPLRVRIAIEGRSLTLHSLAGAQLASWSLDHLENRAVPIFGRDWVIGDRRLPDSALVVENDCDYAALRKAGATLVPLRERTWRQLFYAAQESGNLTGWPVLVPIGISILALWLLFA